MLLHLRESTLSIEIVRLGLRLLVRVLLVIRFLHHAVILVNVEV